VCVCVCERESDQIQQSPSTPVISRSNKPDYKKNAPEKDNSALVVMKSVSKKDERLNPPQKEYRIPLGRQHINFRKN